MMLRPYLVDKGAYLDVSVGTKGGRPRAVPINTPEQKALLDEAKAFAATKDSSTSDPSRSLAQWKNHYYYVLRSCGITRKNGLTAHGLRLTYAHNRYKELSGQDSPVRGGSWSTARMTGPPASRWLRNWGIPGSRLPPITWEGATVRIKTNK